MTDQEIIASATPPAVNPEQCALVSQGQMMVNLLDPFFEEINGVFINTTSPSTEAKLVNVKDITIPPGTKLYIHVQVEGVGRPVEFGVANWLRIFKNAGYHDAVVMCLDVANPAWMQDKELADRVAMLPGPIPDLVVPPPVTPAEPDWTKPRENNCFAVRVGDHSVNGTLYEGGPVGTWIKGYWNSITESVWKRKV